MEKKSYLILLTFVLSVLLGISCSSSMIRTAAGSIKNKSGGTGISNSQNPQATISTSTDNITPDSTSPERSSPQDEPFLVCIDAGHGGKDPGASWNGLIEKNITLDVALKLNNILQKCGISTYMIRTEEADIDRKDRIFSANAKNASLFISIHCDWYKNSSINGTGTFYYPSQNLKLGMLTEFEFAQIMQDELIKVIHTNNRGVIDNTDLAVLRHANMPSVLIELGFISNPGDAALLGSPDFRQAIAEGLAEGIKKSLQKAKGEH